MRSSSKNRSRNKNGRKSLGNVVNRVFESAGPEGKVRGTPQQIIEKYTTLSRDAQTSGDRIVAENFQQHAEHYIRLLAEAQREAGLRQEAAQQQHQSQQPQSDVPIVTPAQREAEGFGTIDPGEAAQPGSGLVDTPEGIATRKPLPDSAEPEQAERPRSRNTRRRPPRKANGGEDAPVTAAPAEKSAPEEDKRPATVSVEAEINGPTEAPAG